MPVSIGHFAYQPATAGINADGFKTLLRLVKDGNTWIKISGANRVSETDLPPYDDVLPMARALVEANPDNVMWSIMVTGQTQSSLSINDPIKDNGMVIAPTLTKDIVKVLKAPKKSVYNVYDLSGKKLQTGIFKNEEETIDLTPYIKGVYIIEVKTEKDTVSKKVIKE